MHKRQLIVFGILLLTYALAAFISVAFIIFAIAFGAGHLPAAMLIIGLESPEQLPPILLLEIFLLNGLVGFVAGNRYMKDGLVAATGVHFWTDIFSHVLWGL